MLQKFFLGGIHGVGKGTFSKRLLESVNLEYLSASQLLKWEEVSPDVKNKKVSNIPNTQERLLFALEKICKKDKMYLLDGHYCLLNEENLPSEVAIEFFRKINPKLFLVLIDDPKIIMSRLKKRDRKNYELSKIIEMQNFEVSYANEIAVKLNRPIVEIKQNNIVQIINKIKRII